ncbi:hypothetical protein D3C81_295880 [compost metagenome]
MSGPVALTPYRAGHREGLLAFTLPQEQEVFTGMPAETLDTALQDDNRDPVVVICGEAPVGFFVLHGWDGIGDIYSGNSRALLLRAYLIDRASQGRGYGRESMALLPDYVERYHPGTEEIVLLVNERNRGAERLYLASGFYDTGLRRLGAKGMQKLLRYDLRPSSARPEPDQ